MDIVSHGLWGSLAFGRKNRHSFLLAFLCGMAPDIFSFGVFFTAVVFGVSDRPDFSEPPAPQNIPHYVSQLYQFTHSFVIFLILFFMLWTIFRRPIWEFSAWGLHILFDIPTHPYQFFPHPIFVANLSL